MQIEQLLPADKNSPHKTLFGLLILFFASLGGGISFYILRSFNLHHYLLLKIFMQGLFSIIFSVGWGLVFVFAYELIKQKKSPADKLSRSAGLFLLAVIAGGFLLRVVGAGWGFPLLLHPDEYAIADKAYEMVRSQSFNPGIYLRPNHVSIYLNAFIYQIASWLRFGQPLAQSFPVKMPFFYLLSRILMAAFGTLIIWFGYLIGKEYDKKLGLLVAFLFAVFPDFVLDAHYIAPDTTLTFFILGVILFSIRYLKTPSFLNLFFAAVFSALAVGEKYPGALAFLLLIAVIMLSDKKEAKILTFKINYRNRFLVQTVRIFLFLLGIFVFSFVYFLPKHIILHEKFNLVKDLFIFSGASLCGLGVFGILVPKIKAREILKVAGLWLFFIFIFTPFLFLSSGDVENALFAEEASRVYLGWVHSLVFYFRQYLISTGFILLFFLALGTVWLIKKYRIYSLPVFFGFFYYLILSNSPMLWLRWGLPMDATFLILAAAGLLGVCDLIGARKNIFLWVIFGFFMIVFWANMMVQNLVILTDFHYKDSRLAAQEFCSKNNIFASNSFFEGWSPFMLLLKWPLEIPEKVRETDELKSFAKKKFGLCRYGTREQMLFGKLGMEKEEEEKLLAIFNDKSTQEAVKRLYQRCQINSFHHDKKYLIVSSGIYDKYFKSFEEVYNPIYEGRDTFNENSLRINQPEALAKQKIYNQIFALPLVKEFRPAVVVPHFGIWEISNIKKGLSFFKGCFGKEANFLTGPVIRIYRWGQ